MKENNLPNCFGVLDIVFPLGRNGLRNTPESCMGCSHKTMCLKTAMTGRDGIKLEEEHMNRAYESGLISFMERWSKKKYLKRRIKKNR